jgi:hypothetical protein
VVVAALSGSCRIALEAASHLFGFAKAEALGQTAAPKPNV